MRLAMKVFGKCAMPPWQARDYQCITMISSGVNLPKGQEWKIQSGQ